MCAPGCHADDHPRVQVCVAIAGLYATISRSVAWLRTFLWVVVVTLVLEIIGVGTIFAGSSRLADARVRGARLCGSRGPCSRGGFVFLLVTSPH